MNIENKCKKIKVVLTDVDGVLTDGGMYYTKDGDIMKKFHTRDGMGVTLLRKNKIPTVIVTKESTMMVKAWAKNMKVSNLYDGIEEKEKIIEKICSEYKVKNEEVAYIGDDVNDMKLLAKVGVSFTPSDSIENVKNICDYICKTKSGQGVFREVADLILNSQNIKL